MSTEQPAKRPRGRPRTKPANDQPINEPPTNEQPTNEQPVNKQPTKRGPGRPRKIPDNIQLDCDSLDGADVTSAQPHNETKSDICIVPRCGNARKVGGGLKCPTHYKSEAQKHAITKAASRVLEKYTSTTCEISTQSVLENILNTAKNLVNLMSNFKDERTFRVMLGTFVNVFIRECMEHLHEGWPSGACTCPAHQLCSLAQLVEKGELAVPVIIHSPAVDDATKDPNYASMCAENKIFSSLHDRSMTSTVNPVKPSNPGEFQKFTPSQGDKFTTYVPKQPTDPQSGGPLKPLTSVLKSQKKKPTKKNQSPTRSNNIPNPADSTKDHNLPVPKPKPHTKEPPRKPKKETKSTKNPEKPSESQASLPVPKSPVKPATVLSKRERPKLQDAVLKDFKVPKPPKKQPKTDTQSDISQIVFEKPPPLKQPKTFVDTDDKPLRKPSPTTAPSLKPPKVVSQSFYGSESESVNVPAGPSKHKSPDVDTSDDMESEELFPSQEPPTVLELPVQPSNTTQKSRKVTTPISPSPGLVQKNFVTSTPVESLHTPEDTLSEELPILGNVNVSKKKSLNRGISTPQTTLNLSEENDYSSEMDDDLIGDSNSDDSGRLIHNLDSSEDVEIQDEMLASDDEDENDDIYQTQDKSTKLETSDSDPFEYQDNSENILSSVDQIIPISDDEEDITHLSLNEFGGQKTFSDLPSISSKH